MNKNRKPVKAKGNNGSLNNFLSLKRVKEFEEELKKVTKEKKKWKVRARKERERRIELEKERDVGSSLEVRSLKHQIEMLKIEIAHLERAARGENPIYEYPKDKATWTSKPTKYNKTFLNENTPIVPASSNPSDERIYEALCELQKIVKKTY